jgi:hypothetical protein
VQLARADRSFDGRAGALGIQASDGDGEETDEMKEIGSPTSNNREHAMPVVSIIACRSVGLALPLNEPLLNIADAYTPRLAADAAATPNLVR